MFKQSSILDPNKNSQQMDESTKQQEYLLEQMQEKENKISMLENEINTKKEESKIKASEINIKKEEVKTKKDELSTQNYELSNARSNLVKCENDLCVRIEKYKQAQSQLENLEDDIENKESNVYQACNAMKTQERKLNELINERGQYVNEYNECIKKRGWACDSWKISEYSLHMYPPPGYCNCQVGGIEFCELGTAPQYRDYKAQAEELSEKIGALNVETQQKTNQLQSCRKQYYYLSDVLKDSQKNLDNKNELKDQAESDKEDAEQKKQEAIKKIEQLEQNISTLKEEINSLVQDLATLELDYSNLEQEYVNLEKECSDLQDELKELSEKLNDIPKNREFNLNFTQDNKENLKFIEKGKYMPNNLSKFNNDFSLFGKNFLFNKNTKSQPVSNNKPSFSNNNEQTSKDNYMNKLREIDKQLNSTKFIIQNKDLKNPLSFGKFFEKFKKVEDASKIFTTFNNNKINPSVPEEEGKKAATNIISDLAADWIAEKTISMATKNPVAGAALVISDYVNEYKKEVTPQLERKKKELDNCKIPSFASDMKDSLEYTQLFLEIGSAPSELIEKTKENIIKPIVKKGVDFFSKVGKDMVQTESLNFLP